MFLCFTNMSQDIPRVSFYYTSTYNTCPLYIHVTPCNAFVHVIYSRVAGQWFHTIPHITAYSPRMSNERVNCVLLFNTFCLTDNRCKLIMELLQCLFDNVYLGSTQTLKFIADNGLIFLS